MKVMKIKNLLWTVGLFATVSSYAQDCVLPVSIQLDEDFTQVPSAAKTILYQSLLRIASDNGLATEAATSPFVLTVHCDLLDKSNLPGPPMQTVCNLGVTIYMADTYAQKKMGSTYLTLNGVGAGEVKSYINAFKRINSNSNDIKAFIANGKKNMMTYYDSQYKNIIEEARRLESLQKYEEALALVLSVPLCSKGGEETAKYGLQLYLKNLDRMNLFLLNEAKAMWASGQSQETALFVFAMLAKIDPDASCYADANKLMKEIKEQTRSDIDFEMRQKYNDEVKLEHERIETARAVGVAYGNGQKPTTTNLMWLK